MLEVSDLVIRYGQRGRKQAPAAVDGVSFSIAAGETLGLVGESGSGKSTIAKAILGLQPVAGGSIRFRGEAVEHASAAKRRALAVDLRAVFQDPYSSFNPRWTIGRSMTSPLRLNGVGAKDATRRAAELLERVGLPASAMSRLPREFSGGQRQRIGVARALISDPKLVVLDEPVSALDLSTQAQILNLLSDLRDERGLAFLFIAHDISVVRFFARRVIVLYRGQVMEEGDVEDVTSTPVHPFTQALAAASPVPHPAAQRARREAREALSIGGSGNVNVQSHGCPFAGRCPLVTEICVSERPPLLPTGSSLAACHHIDRAVGMRADTHLAH
jgi:oligopeptide/dipeptide ABC transporter ATP-binding protein